MTERAIMEWLSRAHSVPAQAYAEWSNCGVALLQCGRQFAAVRIPPALMHQAVGSADPDEVAAALQTMLSGPVLADYRGTGAFVYYVLVQWHAGLIWEQDDEAPCLIDDTYLGVPHVSRTGPPGPYWMIQPSFDGHLCQPRLVRELIARGRAARTPALHEA